MFIAITTYGKIENIYSQVMNMYNKKNIYLIHYNKREKRSDFLKLKEMFQAYPNIEIISKYKVFWGEISIVNAMLYAMQKFLKSDEEYFIHLGAKEVNLHSIEYIEKYIIENSYISINLDRQYLDWYDKMINKKGKDFNKDDWNILYERKFCKLICRYQNIKYLNCIVLIFSALFSNILTKNVFHVIKCIVANVLNAIFGKKDGKQELLYKIAKVSFYHNENDDYMNENLWWQFRKIALTPPGNLNK